MIEQGIGAKAITSVIIKPLLAALVAFGWWPTADFIILQANSAFLLSPNMKIIFQELKEILGVLISIAVLFKIMYGIISLRKNKP